MALTTTDLRPERYCEENESRNRELTNRIRRAHRAMSAAMAEILAAAAEADEAETYWADGAQSVDEWLAGNLMIHGKTARRWARQALKLRDYPEIFSKLASGDLGWEQVCQLLRFVDPEDDATAAEGATDSYADDLAAEARRMRVVPPARVKQARSERFVETFWDHEEMKFAFNGEIAGQDGAIVAKAFELLAWNAPEEPVYELPRHPEHRLADALVEMASNALANHSKTDTATVVIHAEATKLATRDGVGWVEFGPDIPMEAVRRFCCDGRMLLVAHGCDGSVIGVGRISRSIPFWLRRLVRERDKGCRFPGCKRTYWTEIHHIVHWANGGPTDLDNLITLCGHHHRVLHEDGWHISGDPKLDVVFHLPGGAAYRRRPGRRPWQLMRDLDLAAIDHWAQEHDLAKPGPG